LCTHCYCLLCITDLFLLNLRLLTPRLRRRGVIIETEIEYRVSAYFVLGVNIRSVDWGRLVKATNRDVAERKAKWRKEKLAHSQGSEAKDEVAKIGVVRSFINLIYSLTQLTMNEVIAQALAWLYLTHWVVYTPICWFLYSFVMGPSFRNYFLSTVADGEPHLSSFVSAVDEPRTRSG
jgi:hypothetical protein